jgi:hypothetical protein
MRSNNRSEAGILQHGSVASEITRLSQRAAYGGGNVPSMNTTRQEDERDASHTETCPPHTTSCV